MKIAWTSNNPMERLVIGSVLFTHGGGDLRNNPVVPGQITERGKLFKPYEVSKHIGEMALKFHPDKFTLIEAESAADRANAAQTAKDKKIAKKFQAKMKEKGLTTISDPAQIKEIEQEIAAEQAAGSSGDILDL